MDMVPPAYRWLHSLDPLPRMVAQALPLLGTAEVAGAGSNPTILSWAAEIGGAVARNYNADSVPWCGLFMAVVAKRAGKELPADPLWALNWSRFGVGAPRPMLGDVLVFTRPGGAHVALYVGEDAQAYHVLGGNQGDRVCILRVGRGRLHAARRPAYTVRPACVRPYALAATGGLSIDEA